MVTELKERQEKQVTPASREETINRLDVIEQRISEMQGKSGIPENMVQEIPLILNIRFTERMQRLQDNDIKYRYILMKGKADGSSLDLLETKFSRERDNAFIRSLTNSVKGFEYRSRKQAEALERARLLNEQAEQLKEEADKLGKP